MLIPVKCILKVDKVNAFGIYLMGIKLYPRALKKHKKQNASESKSTETESKNQKKDNKDLSETISLLRKVLDILLSSSKKHLIIDDLSVYYCFGLGDAALTGIYSGGVYAIFHGFGAYVFDNFKVKKQKIEIIPDFDNVKNELKINLYFKIRIINLAKTLLKLITVL